MLKEDLRIRLYRDRAKVEVDYLLRNTGEAVDVKAGFPSLGVQIEGEQHREIEDYTIEADGQLVAFTREKGDAKPYRSLYCKDFMAGLGPGWDDGEDKGAQFMLLDWLVSTVHFAAGEIRRVHIRYESIYAFSDEGYSDDSTSYDDRFRSTGAPWKGPIREGMVTISAETVDPSRIVVLPTGRFERHRREWIWAFHDLKPTMADNIQVNLNDHQSTIFNYKEDLSTDESNGSWWSSEHSGYWFNSHHYIPQATAETEGFEAKNVRDYNTTTAWRTTQSLGVGERLTLKIDPPVRVDQIGLVPGCGAGREERLSHSRIRNLEVTVNRTFKSTVTLPDEYIGFGPYSSKGYELVEIRPTDEPAKEIVLTIRGVYPGTKDQATCISEVLLRQRLAARPKVQSGVDGHELP